MNIKEKRKSPRKKVIQTFSLFIVIPKKGVHRLPIHDLSDSGLGFDFDIEGESSTDFPIKTGEEFDIHLYLNQTLFLPLKAKIVRIEMRGTIRRTGAELADTGAPGYKAFCSFVQMLENIEGIAVIQS